MLTDNNTDTENTLSEGGKSRKNIFIDKANRFLNILNTMFYYRILEAKKWHIRLPKTSGSLIFLVA